MYLLWGEGVWDWAWSAGDSLCLGAWEISIVIVIVIVIDSHCSNEVVCLRSVRSRVTLRASCCCTNIQLQRLVALLQSGRLSWYVCFIYSGNVQPLATSISFYPIRYPNVLTLG